MTKISLKTAIRDMNLSSIDIITLIYCLWIMLYMIFGWGRAVNPHIHFPVYLSVAVGVLFLAWLNIRLRELSWQRTAKAIAFVRGIHPVLLFGYFFISGYVVNRIIFSNWQDPFFMRLDYRIFGYLPSMEWGIQYSQKWISELFSFAYFAYYPMIVGLPVYLYLTDKNAFSETIFCLTLVFYLCYFVYSWLPVVGGRYLPEAMELSQESRGYVFSWIMAYIYRTSNHLGGAFPSSHVAIALTLSFSALRHKRRLGIIFAVISIFLAVATVYCHYHWFIDTVAGVLMGIFGFLFALFMYRKLPRTTYE